MKQDKAGLLGRFLAYCAIDSRSDASSSAKPSSPGQRHLAQYIAKELEAMGVPHVRVDRYGVLYAELDPYPDPEKKTLAFFGHFDTPSTFGHSDEPPQRVDNYQGEHIPIGQDLWLSPQTAPELDALYGETLLVNRGKGIMGADSKAGLAEIVTCVEQLLATGAPRGCNLKIILTPDEQIGLGAARLDFSRLGIDWAYTVNGGPRGEYAAENFNAATATLRFTGRPTHPAFAKGMMVNALAEACRFHASLPVELGPEYSEGRQGFVHLLSCEGDMANAQLVYAIRAFDHNEYERLKALVGEKASAFNARSNGGSIELDLVDAYINMAPVVERLPQVRQLAHAAMAEHGITLEEIAIRGGTDGAFFAAQGIACPNLFTGGYYFHSHKEFVSLDAMHDAVKVLVSVVRLAGR